MSLGRTGVCVCVCVWLSMFRIAYYHNSYNTLVRCSVYSYFAKFLWWYVKQKCIYCRILLRLMDLFLSVLLFLQIHIILYNTKWMLIV